MSVCYFSFWHFNLSWRSIFFVMFNIALCSMFPYVVLYPEPKEVKFMNKRTNTFEPFNVVLSYMEKNIIQTTIHCLSEFIWNVSFSLLNWFAHTRPTEPHTREIRASTRFKKVAALNRKFLRLNDFHSVSNIPWIFRNLCTFLCSVVFQWCSNGGSTQYTKYHVLCIHLYWWCTLRTT